MPDTLARRRPEAVKALEALQQRERAGAGEPILTSEDFLKKFREDVEMDLISRRLDEGGLYAVVRAVEEDQTAATQQVDAALKAWHLDDPTQWSRYEAPGVRWRLAGFCARIEATFARLNLRLPELPVVGTLTTGQVSASTQLTASGAPLVLIDNGFFKFAGMMGQLSIFAPYDAAVRGTFTDATLQLVADLAVTHAVLNTSLYVYKRGTPPQFEARLANLVDAICTFVIAHEYAHVAAGDLNEHPLDEKRMQGGRRQREFDADKTAFRATLDVGTGDPSTACYGPFLYFAGLDLLDRAVAAYRRQQPVTESSADGDYPTPFERTVNLLELFKTSPAISAYAQTAREAAAVYNTILFAWDSIFPAFWEAADELAAFSPEIQNDRVLPEARTFGLVTTLWAHVEARRGHGV